MSDHNLDNSIQKVGSDAYPQKRYSAKELGEMMNNCPLQLFNVDIAACTDWYTNDDYMEEMLSYVVEEQKIDNMIEFILMKHEYQTVTEHHPKVCYRVADERKYVPYVEDLNMKLEAMRVRVLHSREVAARMEEMKKRWASATTSTAKTSSVAVPLSDPSAAEKNETKPPSFDDDSTDSTVEYHLSDLPSDVRSKILIYDDKKYTVFVIALRGPVKEWIDNHRLQDWNVVRFICRLRNIVEKRCSIRIFGSFLKHIGLGNQKNNMKQRQDANDKNALTAYDDSKAVNPNFFKLRKDGKEVEELLADVIEYDTTKMTA